MRKSGKSRASIASGFKETQVVFALITTVAGLPITYEVFPGNTHEMKTLLPVIRELKEEFDVRSIRFAADRGMFSIENIEALEQEGLSYMIGAKLKVVSREILSIHALR